MSDRPMKAEFVKKCDHICMMEEGHQGIHQYGYEHPSPRERDRDYFDAREELDKLRAAPVNPVPAPRLEWREGKAASVGPMTGQITKWHTTTEVTDGKLYWSIAWAAEDRFVLRVKDDNRTDTVWLGHRSSLDAAKSLAEKLNAVLAATPKESE